MRESSQERGVHIQSKKKKFAIPKEWHIFLFFVEWTTLA